MKENFSHRYIHNLKSQSATGKIVNTTIFSEYRSDKAALKEKTSMTSYQILCSNLKVYIT